MEKRIINGIDVNYIPVKKFKHIMIGFCFQSKLDPTTYNERHMLPSLLEQSNAVYSNIEKLNTQLDMLYGAAFNASVFQRGEMLSTQFFIRIINDKYVPDQSNLLEHAFEFLYRIIYQPKTYRGQLTHKSVKEKLIETKEILKTIRQDKASLAYYRFINHISSEVHPSQFPIESRLGLVTQESLTRVYHQLIQEDELKIYVIGDFDSNRMDRVIASRLSQLLTEDLSVNYRVKLPEESPIGCVEEKADVSISRVYLGYKIHIELNDKEEVMMELLNIILGGYSQSKMFKIIREDMHLVYYIYSTYRMENEMFIIHFECEQTDEEKAIAKAKAIVDDFKHGDVLDEELALAKQLLANNYKSVMDQLSGMFRINILSDLVMKRPFDTQERIRWVQSITKEELVEFSKRLAFHINYCFHKGGELVDKE